MIKQSIYRFCLCAGLSVGMWQALSAQRVFFVSTSGNNTNPGTEEQPFATLQKALEEARPETGEVTIYMRGGTYRVETPVVLGNADGNNSKHLFIKAYKGEKPVISGGKILDLHWKPYKGGIMVAEIAGQPVMDVLVVNGEIRHMARFPNFDEKAVRFNGTSADATSPERVKRWKHPETGFLHAMHAHDWGDFHYRITGADRNGELMLEGGWQNNRPMGLHPDNRMVENIFEELDAPGEWFYDEKKGLLYYYPMEGEYIQTAVFESPQVKHLMEFRGTMEQPVQNIEVQGLEFTQTTRTFMENYEPLLRSDWTVYRGAALFFEGTENCVLRGCDLYNLGGNAVFFSRYNRGAEVSGCHFTDIGASAVCFVGDAGAVRSPKFNYNEPARYEEADRCKGAIGKNYPAFCRVEDNLIHHIGLFEKQVTGVELSMCRSVTVAHNSIYDTPRSGINISEGTWGGHIIEFNDVFDTVKETGDHGSFNSWGRDRFWSPDYQEMERYTLAHPEMILADMEEMNVIRYNRFRCDRGWDIDLDDGSSNYHIYNNLCLNGGIKLREGFYRVVENNVLVNNTFHPHVWFGQSGDVFTRNIVMSAYQPIQIRQWGQMTDYNIFTDSLAYKAARMDGTDVHSVVMKVNFMAPEKGNYALTEGDEALASGLFHNFPMDRFGVTSPRLKSIAETPVMPVPMFGGEEELHGTKEWKGAVIKSLVTLGERSATGMDEERGVYVVSVGGMSDEWKKYLRENDVILNVNGQETRTRDEFFKVVAALKKQQTVRMLVFRAQQEHWLEIPSGLFR